MLWSSALAVLRLMTRSNLVLLSAFGDHRGGILARTSAQRLPGGASTACGCKDKSTIHGIAPARTNASAMNRASLPLVLSVANIARAGFEARKKALTRRCWAACSATGSCRFCCGYITCRTQSNGGKSHFVVRSGTSMLMIGWRGELDVAIVPISWPPAAVDCRCSDLCTLASPGARLARHWPSRCRASRQR
jgi:hypothetical protein